MLGLGVWQMAAGAETEQAVGYALEVGYRHIDTASLYRNEQSVGAALKRSGLPRDRGLHHDQADAHPPKRCASVGKEPRAPEPRLRRPLSDPLADPLPQRAILARVRIAPGTGADARDRRQQLRRSRSSKRYPSMAPYPRSTRCNSARTTTAGDCSTTAGNTESCSRPIARSSAERAFATRRSRRRRASRPQPAQVMLRWAIQHEAIVIPKSITRNASKPMPRCSTSHSATPTCGPSMRSTGRTQLARPPLGPTHGASDVATRTRPTRPTSSFPRAGSRPAEYVPAPSGTT